MLMNMETPKESGGAALRFNSQCNAPPDDLLRQHRTPLRAGVPGLNRMVRVRLRTA